MVSSGFKAGDRIITVGHFSKGSHLGAVGVVHKPSKDSYQVHIRLDFYESHTGNPNARYRYYSASDCHSVPPHAIRLVTPLEELL